MRVTYGLSSSYVVLCLHWLGISLLSGWRLRISNLSMRYFANFG